MAAVGDREVERDREESNAGVHEDGAAPTELAGEKIADRPEDGRCQAAEQRDLGDRALGIGSADAGKRRERGIIKRQAHTEAEAEPRGIVGRDVVTKCEGDAAQERDSGAGDHHAPAAVSVDQSSAQRGQHAHEEQCR